MDVLRKNSSYNKLMYNFEIKVQLTHISCNNMITLFN